MSALADHRVDPGDDGRPAAASRHPVPPPCDVTQGDASPSTPGRATPCGPGRTPGPTTPGPTRGRRVRRTATPTRASTPTAGIRVRRRRARRRRAPTGCGPTSCGPTSVPTSRPTTSGSSRSSTRSRSTRREAHDVVQDAYSRAWRKWAEIGASADPGRWVRRVAVRSTMRSWRRALARIGPGTPAAALADGVEPRTRAALLALGRLRDAERRAVVLVDMAGVPVVGDRRAGAGAAGDVAARLSRGRRVVGDGLDRGGCGPPRLARSARGGGTDDGDRHARVSQELRELDDELAAAVELPPVDSVIRQAGRTARASTAAAAAVLTVGGTRRRHGRHAGGRTGPRADAAPASIEAAGPRPDHHHDHHGARPGRPPSPRPRRRPRRGEAPSPPRGADRRPPPAGRSRPAARRRDDDDERGARRRRRSPGRPRPRSATPTTSSSKDSKKTSDDDN